jgi:hypothetical protein
MSVREWTGMNSKMRTLMALVILSILYLAMRQAFSFSAFYGLATSSFSLRWRFAHGGHPFSVAWEVFSLWSGRWLLACGLPLIAWWLWYRRSKDSTPIRLSPKIIPLATLAATMGFLILRFQTFSTRLVSVDEFAYDFEAKLLSKLQLATPLWPVSESLRCDGLVFTADRVTAAWQPGWSACLVVFQGLGLGFVANCLIWTLLVVSVGFLADKMWDREAAYRACLMVLVCPPFWMLTTGSFPHLWIALLSVLALHSYLRFRDGRDLWPLFCFCTLIAVTRLQDLVCVMVVVLVWQKTERHPLIAVFCLSVAASLVLNYVQTGYLFHLPTLLLYDNLSMGAGWRERVLDTVHGHVFLLARALWWTGPLFLLRRQKEMSNWDRGLLLGIVASILVYLPKYGLANVDSSTRYYTQTFLLLCLLIGPGLRLSKSTLVGLCLTLFAGLQALSFCAKSYDTIITPPPMKHGLYFFRTPPSQLSQSALVRNSPDLSSPVSALWFNDAQNRRVMQAFPKLTPYVVDFQDGEFRVSEYQSDRG